MKTMLSILLFLVLSPVFQTNFSLENDVKINGLLLVSPKAAILKKLGKPKRVYAPHYECGWDDHDDVVHYVLEYNYVTFIGNKEMDYVINEINFSPSMHYKITYKRVILNSQTTLTTFLKLSGQSNYITEERKNTPAAVLALTKKTTKVIKLVIVRKSTSDDSTYFYFANDKLVRFEYFTPC